DTIWLLVVARGKSRLCAAQVVFCKDSGEAGHVRSYLVYHVPPRSNGKARTEGWWRAWSLADKVKRGDLDLRRSKDAAALEVELLRLDLSALTANDDTEGQGKRK